MRVKVIVEFEVEPVERALNEEFTHAQGIDAGDLAVRHSLALTNTGESIVDHVIQHVEGFGHCLIRLVED